MKHTGLSKEDIVKESDNCYLIQNQIFGLSDCVDNDNPFFDKDDSYMIINEEIVERLQTLFGVK